MIEGNEMGRAHLTCSQYVQAVQQARLRALAELQRHRLEFGKELVPVDTDFYDFAGLFVVLEILPAGLITCVPERAQAKLKDHCGAGMDAQLFALPKPLGQRRKNLLG